ncbi:MAG: response regulator [Chloroflexota bacterium]
MVKKTIAIVDDDRLLSRTIDVWLRKKGHDVRVFHNGADVVKYLFGQKQPDLMVLDIRLPDCSGWFIAGLLEKLELAKKVPLVVLSVLEQDRAKVSEVRPFAYIQKPFDMGHLVQTVESALA